MICLQEISEINSKPSARYALALFSLYQEGKTDNEIEKHVLNLLEILKSDNGLNSFLRKEFWDDLNKYQITDFSGVPTTYKSLLKLDFVNLALSKIIGI